MAKLHGRRAAEVQKITEQEDSSRTKTLPAALEKGVDGLLAGENIDAVA